MAGNSSPSSTKRNASALLAVQLLNAGLPLLVLPHLTSSLGVATYGVAALGAALVSIGVIVSAFGFEISATYDIARSKSANEVNEIYGAVLTTKAFLGLLSGGLVALYPLLGLNSGAYSSFFLVMGLSLALQALQPQFLFQGIERMAPIAVSVLAGKLLYVVLIFLLVTHPKDLQLVGLASLAAQLLIAALLIPLAALWGYRPSLPSPKVLRAVVLRSFPFFGARTVAGLYTSGGTVILGSLGLHAAAGIYAIADQLYKGTQSLFTPLSQAMLPAMARGRTALPLRRLIAATVTLSLLCLAGAAAFGRQVIDILTSGATGSFSKSYDVLLVLFFCLTVTTASSLLGYPGLGSQGRIGLANRSVYVGGLVYAAIISVLLTTGSTSVLLLAVALTLTEIVVLSLRLRFYEPQLFGARS